MKKRISAIALACVTIFSSCKPTTDYHLNGVIGTDDSSEVNSVPEYAVAVMHKIDNNNTSYCNGVKLQDGRFLGALHCFKHQQVGLPIATSGGFATEISRVNKADLLVGKMVGSVAPSSGAKVYVGDLPLEIELEAHWFDPFSRTWRISKGHGKRNSTNDLIWKYDLDLNPGASGAGLFFVTDSGERRLVGIHLGFAKDHNVGLVYAAEYPAGVALPVYTPEICITSVETDADGKPLIQIGCEEEGGDDDSSGNPGGPGQGEDPGASPGGPASPGSPSTPGGPASPGDPSSPGGPGEIPGGTPGGPDIPGSTGSPDDEGYSPAPGIELRPNPGSGGHSTATPGTPSRIGNGQPCHACGFFTKEKEKKSYFQPKCDQDAGFTGLFGDKTPSSDRLKLGGIVTQTNLTDALRTLAEKMIEETKWKSPEGMPSKLSQLSEEARKRLEDWLNKVIKSADDYYAMVISSLNSMNKPDQPVFNDTEEGIKAARLYLEFLKQQIAANPDEFSARRYSVLDASAKFLDVADIQIKNNNPQNAYIALQMSLATADVTLSLSPGLGWGKDVYEAWTGYSFTSGKQLTTLERSFAIGGAVTVGTLTAVGTSAKVFMAGTVVFKDAAKLAKTAEELEQIEKATQNLIEMGKNAEKAGVSADMAAEGLRSTQRIVRQGKHLESVAHDGRSVYKTTSFEGGKIPFVAENVNDSIKQSIANGATNLDLMKKGNAPIGADGRQVNLHHIFGFEPGPIIEMEATAHTEVYKEFHKMIKDSFRNEGDLGPKFDAFRKKYWKARADDFIKELE